MTTEISLIAMLIKNLDEDKNLVILSAGFRAHPFACERKVYWQYHCVFLSGGIHVTKSFKPAWVIKGHLLHWGNQMACGSTFLFQLPRPSDWQAWTRQVVIMDRTLMALFQIPRALIQICHCSVDTVKQVHGLSSGKQRRQREQECGLHSQNCTEGSCLVPRPALAGFVIGRSFWYPGYY